MVSRLRLCRAIQSARAAASATVVIASTSTASASPKIKVDVIGSKPSASPRGFGRSPTIGFPGAVKTFTPSVLDPTGAVSFSPFVPPIWNFHSMLEQMTAQRKVARRATTSPLDERIDPYQCIGWTLRSATAIVLWPTGARSATRKSMKKLEKQESDCYLRSNFRIGDNPPGTSSGCKREG